MEKRLSRYVFRNAMLRYLVALTVYAVIMILVVATAYYLLKQRIWYIEDSMYPLLHWIHERFVYIAIIAFLGGAMLISFIFFYRIARRMEILMKQEQREKEDMIMYMAHDLRTPLTSVLGYLKLLKDRKDIPEDLRQHYTEIVLNKAARLEDLINEFFDVTRMGSSGAIFTTDTVNFSRMMEQLVYEFQPVFATKELTYALSVDSDINVNIDAEKMVRVIENLLKNAVNYSYPKTEILVDMKKKDRNCICTITNHGKTIPKEKLEHLFERFYRVDDDDTGTGLGLVIVKQIIDLHGGNIVCQSSDERVIFTFTLPLASSQPANVRKM